MTFKLRFSYHFLFLPRDVLPMASTPFVEKAYFPLLNCFCKFVKNQMGRGFPGGAVIEYLPANAGDMGSSPGLGRSHMLWSN